MDEIDIKVPLQLNVYWIKAMKKQLSLNFSDVHTDPEIECSWATFKIQSIFVLWNMSVIQPCCHSEYQHVPRGAKQMSVIVINLGPGLSNHPHALGNITNISFLIWVPFKHICTISAGIFYPSLSPISPSFHEGYVLWVLVSEVLTRIFQHDSLFLYF